MVIHVKLEKLRIMVHPNGQNRRKSSLLESILTIWHCILSAELTRNALFQTVFLAILPTGI